MIIIAKAQSKNSYTLNSAGSKITKIYNSILENEIDDITDTVINAFYYHENQSNQHPIKQDKSHKILVPFYDEMIKNAVNRISGSNNMKVELPQHPQKIITDFSKQVRWGKSQPNHFYAFQVGSLISYLVPHYWIHMQKLTGMAPARQAFDLYQIPLNSTSTINYYAFRGDNNMNIKRLFNCFLFGGDVKDPHYQALKNFTRWANDFIPKHPIAELKKHHIQLNKTEIRG